MVIEEKCWLVVADLQFKVVRKDEARGHGDTWGGDLMHRQAGAPAIDDEHVRLPTFLTLSLQMHNSFF